MRKLVLDEVGVGRACFAGSLSLSVMPGRVGKNGPARVKYAERVLQFVSPYPSLVLFVARVLLRLKSHSRSITLCYNS